MLHRITSNDFGAYHDLYSLGSTVSRIGDRFEATLTARRAAGLLLFDRQVAGAVHEREAARVRRDDLEHFNLQVLRSGRMLAGPPGGERLLAAGDAVLFDTTLPQRTVLYEADYVTVSLARPVVEAAVPDARRLHGLVLAREAYPGLGDAVLSLAHGASGACDATLGGSRLIAGLLAPVADRAGGKPEPDEGEDAEAARRLRASLFIETHLGRRDLDVDTVASGSGLSRSALYRAFAPAGGVEGEIVRRRVARLRSAVLRGDGAVPIANLAWDLGFSTPSHCSRAFKAAYGVSPRQFRAEMLASQESAVADLTADHLRRWLQGLRRTSPSP